MKRSSLASWTAILATFLLTQTPSKAQTPPKSSSPDKPIAFSGELRGRFESPTTLGYKEDADDSYLLTRARLQMRIRAASWLSGTVEVQDSRAPGLNSPQPANVVNGFDLRQAWVRFAPTGESGLSIKAGRMPIRLGSGRLVWDPDWSNTGVVFDGVHASWAEGRTRVDAIAASPLTPRDRSFDRTAKGVLLYGAMGAVRVGGGARIEPYLLLRRYAAPLAASPETHSAWGGRLVGSVQMPGDTKTSYEVEATGQSGTLRGAPLRAWGMVSSVSAAPFHSKLAPSLTATYTFATGDHTPSDGTRGTFQVFYPTVHLRTGATDRLGWSNLRDWLGEARWALPRKTGLSTGFHLPSVDTAADALYSKSGAPILYCPGATSPRIGTELFLLLDREFSPHWSAGAGVAHLFPGPFLQQAGRTSEVTQPYGYLTFKF